MQALLPGLIGELLLPIPLWEGEKKCNTCDFERKGQIFSLWSSSDFSCALPDLFYGTSFQMKNAPFYFHQPFSCTQGLCLFCTFAIEVGLVRNQTRREKTAPTSHWVLSPGQYCLAFGFWTHQKLLHNQALFSCYAQCCRASFFSKDHSWK